MENGKWPKGQKIGKLWYLSEENLEAFLDGDEGEKRKKRVN
jgi:hypothetical protein